MILGVCLTTLAVLVGVALLASPGRRSSERDVATVRRREGPVAVPVASPARDPAGANDAPDPSSLAVMPLDEVVDLDAVPVVDRLTFRDERADLSMQAVEPHELRRFRDLPPIAGPGLHPLPRAGA